MKHIARYTVEIEGNIPEDEAIIDQAFASASREVCEDIEIVITLGLVRDGAFMLVDEVRVEFTEYVAFEDDADVGRTDELTEALENEDLEDELSALLSGPMGQADGDG